MQITDPTVGTVTYTILRATSASIYATDRYTLCRSACATIRESLKIDRLTFVRVSDALNIDLKTGLRMRTGNRCELADKETNGKRSGDTDDDFACGHFFGKTYLPNTSDCARRCITQVYLYHFFSLALNNLVHAVVRRRAIYRLN